MYDSSAAVVFQIRIPKENLVLLNRFPESLGNYEYLILPDSSLLSAIVFFIFLVESSTDQTHCLHFTYFLRVMFCFPVKFSMPPSCKRNVLWHDLVSHRCLVAVSLSSAGLDRRAPPLSVRLPVSSLHQTERVFGQSGGDVVQECGQGTAGSGLAGECLRVCAVTQRPLSFI